MQRFLTPVALLLASVFATGASAQTWLLTDEAWARPRQGALLLHNPAIHATVDAWMKADTGFILIRYPGDDEGEVWAGELRDWLIALGIPSNAIRMQPGNARDDVLTMTLENTKRDQF